jgi:hypothetical protein
MLVVTVLLLSVVLLTCEQALSPELNKIDVVYEMKISAMKHGEITAVPELGFAGTEVKFIINPEPGYKLGSIKCHNIGISNIDGSNVSDINRNPQNIYAYDMPEGGAWISAEFVPLGANERSVSLQTGEHGKIIAVPTSGIVGTTVRLYSYIDSGYSFKPEYPRLSGGAWVAGKQGFEFTIGNSGNVTLLSEFEKPDRVDGILDSAREAMSAEEYDAAFSFYEVAYQADKTNPEAIFYSTVGKFLSIGTDPRVRVLLRKPGIVAPGTINDWLNLDTAQSTNWLQKYTDDNGDTYTLPRLGPPGNFPGSFLNYDIYQKNTGKRRVFDVLLFWNMVSNNPNGFNELLDDALKYIFGEQFEEACRRAASFSENELVLLNGALKAKFKLDELYGSGTINVGRAELDVLVSFLRSLKAAVEWAASYNWEMDLTLLRVEIGNEDTLNVILDKVLNKTLKNRFELDGNYTILSKFLPLRGHFLKKRDDGLMYNAKGDFAASITLLNKSLDSFYGRFDAAVKNKYAWLTGEGGFARQLKSVMASGGNFYIPEIPKYKSVFYAMEDKSLWVGAGEAKNGINLGKFFVPGCLTADRLIRTEAGGKAPLFIGFTGGTDAGKAVSDDTELAGFDTFSMEFSPNFKDVFVKIKGKTTSEYTWVSDIFPDLFPQSGDVMDRIFAKGNVIILYDLYQRR